MGEKTTIADAPAMPPHAGPSVTKMKWRSLSMAWWTMVTSVLLRKLEERRGEERMGVEEDERGVMGEAGSHTKDKRQEEIHKTRKGATEAAWEFCKNWSRVRFTRVTFHSHSLAWFKRRWGWLQRRLAHGNVA